MDSSPHSPEEQLSPARRAAIQWVSRLALGDVTPDELDDLKAWLAADPRNRLEFDIARRKWAELEALRPKPTAMRRPARRVALAASVAAVCLATAAAWNLRSASHDFTSPVGTVRQVALADGSKLWLDTDTAVDFSRTDDARTLKVARGRVYLAVAPDRARPLSVEAAGYTVRDIGTAFSVDTGQHALRVAVTSGEVRVSRAGIITTLRANDAASFRSSMAPVPERLDSMTDVSWRDGRITLDHTPLQDALRTISRYRRGSVWLLDAGLGRRRVSGQIPLDDLEGGLDALAASAELRLVRLPYLLLVLGAENDDPRRVVKTRSDLSLSPSDR